MAGSFFSRLAGSTTLARKVPPGKTQGVPGVSIVGGYVDDNETNAALAGGAKYQTYSELLANVSIVAAGVRYFLNLVAKAEISVSPSDADTSGEFAKKVEAMLKTDGDTPLHRIVRRGAMYRFYGFSVQECTWKKHDDGHWTLKDVAPRPQKTIAQWDTERDGTVLGIVQVAPDNGQPIYLPRGKVLYLVDDTLSDSPEGLGLFRHLVEPASRLKRFEQLEGLGYDNDLKGMPVFRGPFNELRKKVQAGEITQAERSTMITPLANMAKGHVRGKSQSLVLDSETYATKDDANKPGNIYKYGVELLKSDARGSIDAIANAIERVNREMARILGVEQLLLGNGAGSHALSRDKTNSFFLIADSTLKEVLEGLRDDAVDQMFKLNGWPEEMKPKTEAEAIRFRDIEKIVLALKDLATAGAVLDPDDPAINEVRALLGLSGAPEWDPEREAALLDAEDGDETPPAPKKKPKAKEPGKPKDEGKGKDDLEPEETDDGS